MARDRNSRSNRSDPRLDLPRGLRTTPSLFQSRDRFGRFTEAIARRMGTPWFLFGLSIFVIVWMIYNTLAPEGIRFDSAAIGFTALTLILSLQASYAAPLILLALMNSFEARSFIASRNATTSRARYSVSLRLRSARWRSCSICTRSRSSCRFWASRISGAA